MPTPIATFTVTMSAQYTLPASVDYTTVAGTGVAGVNFTPTSGTLVFAPGITTLSIAVPITQTVAAATFSVLLSNPINCVLNAGTGTVTIPITGTTPISTTTYLDRFNWTYAAIKNTANGYFGPPTGAKAFQMPYHSVETLIAEAPDHGHESVSETISYWTKLEAWEIALNGNTAGYAAMWTSIESNYVPSPTNQPWGAYTPASPATYTPDGDQPSAYPTLASSSVATGADPLATPLQTTYGTLGVYLMHWLYDVDGVYGFHNGDGTTKGVALNNYSRGMHEGLFQTVMHVGWEDWTQGGNAYGFLPIYSQGLPTYPAAANLYAKQFSYTAAPDAEVRTIASSFLAHRFAADQGLSVVAQDAKAKKMGDYLRYCLYDKYFKAIPGYDGSGAHNLISWYTAWGGEIPTSGAGSWGFRIGSSESHFGYNGVDAAYAMATAGGGYSPTTSGAGTQWQNSVQRQLEMIRWLQSPEGAIAGGVTNSWLGRYETPSDGRQTAKFYGLYYTYSPVWHTPPSNKWAGFQAWGVERVASLYLTVAAKTDSFSINIRNNCAVILDRFVPWLLANSTLVGTTSFTVPTELGWTSATQIAGQTSTTPNTDGVYEYLPTLNWDSTGNYATFWSGSAVPNPNLHCTITSSGVSLGVAASFAQLLIQYAEAKRVAGGALTDLIPGGSHTVMEAYTLAKGLMDAIWTTQDTIGFAVAEARADYTGFAFPTYLPPGYHGTMHNGDVLTAGTTTFISARSFIKSDPDWAKVQAYLDGGAAPVFNYHRFWEQTEIAAGFAMLQKYFPDLLYAGA